MKIAYFFWTLSIMTATILLVSCKNENNTCTDEEVFCSFVNDQNFDGTGQLIDSFLGTLEKNDTKALEKLKGWLDCKSCVLNTEILCNSCIFTFPAQSELRLRFNANGQTVELTLDILMTEKLKFIRYHE
jgi:hypothetical protein